MKQRLIYILLCLPLLLVGCSDRLFIEEAEIPLVIGIDLNQEGDLVFYSSAPIFNQESEKKYTVSKVTSSSFREAKERIDAKGLGFLEGGKIQNFLIHRRVFDEKNIFPYLDVMYRDAKNDINARIIAVEGSLERIFSGDLDGNYQLAVLVKNLAEQAEIKGFGMAPRLFNHHRNMVDPRITPALLLFKPKAGKIDTTGTLLLYKNGESAFSLDKRESMLLRILKKKMKGPLSFMFSVPQTLANDLDTFHINILSIKEKVKTDYQKNRFVFNIEIDMKVDITEKIFFSRNESTDLLEQWIEEQMKREFTDLIQKMKQNRLDPVGFGVYAKAFQYEHWKKVKEDWPSAWKNAEFHIQPKVKVRSEGVLM